MRKFFFWLLAPSPAVVFAAVLNLGRNFIALSDQVQALQKAVAQLPHVSAEMREHLNRNASFIETSNERLIASITEFEKHISFFKKP